MAQARVRDVQALANAKAAMADFAQSVDQAIASVDADINRFGSWLHAQPAHWKRRVRQVEDELQKARQEVERKRLIAAPEPASVALEQKVVNRLREKLQRARAREESARKWSPVWEREAMLYKSSTAQLTEFVRATVPQAIARLELMTRALEQYAAARAPEFDGIDAVTADAPAQEAGSGPENAGPDGHDPDAKAGPDARPDERPEGGT